MKNRIPRKFKKVFSKNPSYITFYNAFKNFPFMFRWVKCVSSDFVSIKPMNIDEKQTSKKM